MEIKTRTLISSDNKLKLSLCEYISDDPKGIIIISHGMSEHKERYYDFMKFLCEHHYHVIISDLRGHGESVLKEDDYGYFYDNDGNAIVEDLRMIVEDMKKRYKGIPCYLFSHSMGTLIAHCFLKKYDSMIDGVMFCGQPCKNALVTPGLLLAKLIQIFKGDHYRSKLLQNISIAPYDKKIEGTTLNRWLSHVEKVVEDYNQDKKCGFIFTTNGFINLFNLIKKAYKKNNVRNPHLPITFIAGAKDPVIGSPKKFYEEQKFIEKQGYKDVQSILYDDLYHEILNETEYLAIYNDILFVYDAIQKNNP